MDYIQSQYERTVSADLSDGELISMLSGGGGYQIDAVFYVVNKSELLSTKNLCSANRSRH